MSKFCSNCGKNLEEDTKFCPECGETIDKQQVNNKSQQITKQCRYCKKDIDINATVCPYCRQGQKRGTGCGTIVLCFFLLIIGSAVFLAVTGRGGILNSSDLVIENASGSHNALGVSIWKGDLVNKGSVSIENVVIKYTCYNESKEYVGTVQSKIKRIEGNEIIHFQATGLVKAEGQVTCEPAIKIVSNDEFESND